MQNASAMKGVLDAGKKDGGKGKAPQAGAFKMRKEQEREDAIRAGAERSILDKKGDRT